MPLSITNKLDMSDINSTTISLQLADWSIKYSASIIEDVLLKVGKFYVRVNFVVL